MTKKLLSISVIACSVLLLAGCGGTKTTVTTDTVTPTTATTTTNKTPATKSQCLDLMAYAFLVAQYQAAGDTDNVNKFANKAGDLENKYLDANVDYEESCNKFLSADLNFFKEIQKRMEQLK